MGTAGPAMVPLPDNPVAGHDHRPDHRIGAGASLSLGRQPEGQRHVPIVAVRVFHRFLARVEADRRVRPAVALFFEERDAGFFSVAPVKAACAAASRAIATR
jgi:hypothetical protein